MKPLLSERLEILSLIVIASIGLIITILDISDTLDSVPWLSKRIPTIILLSVSVIASYLILERRNALNKISKQLKNFDRGTEVIRFSSNQEAIDCLAKAIQNATSSGDQASLDFKRGRSKDLREKYDSEYYN